jgi:predicted dehydrogenase
MHTSSRRELLAGASLGLSAATAFGSQANSAVSFGVIGTGARGQYVGKQMANDGRARVAAICDRFDDRLEQARKNIPGADAAKTYQDYRQVLDDKSIDAVLIATPVYMHPEMFEAAVASGKHVYCEKPAGMDVAGAQRVMKAGGKASPAQVIQFGFQQRFSPEYLAARALVEAGELGEPRMMFSYWVLGGVPRLTPPSKPPFPNETDAVRKIRAWTSWRALSGGDIVECDCHGLDTLNWFANAHPVKALGQGGLRYPLYYGDITSDYYNIIFTYPNGVTGSLISARKVAGYRDVREQFFGAKGLLETARTYYKLHGPVAAARLTSDDILDDKSMIRKAPSKREITIDAVAAFFTAITEHQPRNMAQVAGTSTLTSILGRMAYEEKREVTWDEMLKRG